MEHTETIETSTAIPDEISGPQAIESPLEEMSAEALSELNSQLKNELKDSKSPKKQSEAKGELSDKDRIASLEKQIKNLEKIKNDRGLFIDKQNEELSSNKTRLSNLTNRLKQLEDKSSETSFWDNPEEAMDARDEKNRVKKEIAELSQVQSYSNKKQQLMDMAPDYDSLIDDIVDFFKETDPKFSEKEAEVFKKDPYNILNPETFIHYVNNARIFKKMKSVSSVKKEGTVSDKVKAAANHKTATSALGTQVSSNFEDVDTESMTFEELEEYNTKLKQKYRQGIK